MCAGLWTCVRVYVEVFVCAHVSPCVNRFKTSFTGIFCSPGPGVQASGELRANVCVTKRIKGECSVVSLIFITVGPSPTCVWLPLLTPNAGIPVPYHGNGAELEGGRDDGTWTFWRGQRWFSSRCVL